MCTIYFGHVPWRSEIDALETEWTNLWNVWCFIFSSSPSSSSSFFVFVFLFLVMLFSFYFSVIGPALRWPKHLEWMFFTKQSPVLMMAFRIVVVDAVSWCCLYVVSSSYLFFSRIIYLFYSFISFNILLFDLFFNGLMWLLALFMALTTTRSKLTTAQAYHVRKRIKKRINNMTTMMMK